MSVSAAVIGMLPESPDLSELEALSGEALAHLHFARDAQEARELLPDSDYVVVCARHLSEASEEELRGLREQCPVPWVLLRGDHDGVLPSWTPSLQFDHELHSPRRAPTSEPSAAADAQLLRVGSLSLNTRSGELQVGGCRVQLTPRECRLLSVFLQRPNQVLKKEELMEGCWGESNHHINLVQVTIRRLRQKLQAQVGRSDLIENCRGFGYKLKA